MVPTGTRAHEHTCTPCAHCQWHRHPPPHDLLTGCRPGRVNGAASGTRHGQWGHHCICHRDHQRSLEWKVLVRESRRSLPPASGQCRLLPSHHHLPWRGSVLCICVLDRRLVLFLARYCVWCSTILILCYAVRALIIFRRMAHQARQHSVALTKRSPGGRTMASPGMTPSLACSVSLISWRSSTHAWCAAAWHWQATATAHTAKE